MDGCFIPQVNPHVDGCFFIPQVNPHIDGCFFIPQAAALSHRFIPILMVAALSRRFIPIVMVASLSHRLIPIVMVAALSHKFIPILMVASLSHRFILPDQREPNDQSTHKWMVYVRGPSDDQRIDSFVSKVWFFLHPSYRPNDLVEVRSVRVVTWWKLGQQGV